MVAPFVLEQELLFLLLEQLPPEQVAPLVQEEPLEQLDPLEQLEPVKQFVPLLQPSLLKMLLISPDCPKQLERLKLLPDDTGQVAAWAVIGTPATVSAVAAAKTNTGNFLMVISSLFVTQLLHFCYKMYLNIQEMEYH